MLLLLPFYTRQSIVYVFFLLRLQCSSLKNCSKWNVLCINNINLTKEKGCSIWLQLKVSFFRKVSAYEVNMMNTGKQNDYQRLAKKTFHYCLSPKAVYNMSLCMHYSYNTTSSSIFQIHSWLPLVSFCNSIQSWIISCTCVSVSRWHCSYIKLQTFIMPAYNFIRYTHI